MKLKTQISLHNPSAPIGAPPLAGEAQEWRGIAFQASTVKGRWCGAPEGCGGLRAKTFLVTREERPHRHPRGAE